MRRNEFKASFFVDLYAIFTVSIQLLVVAVCLRKRGGSSGRYNINCVLASDTCFDASFATYCL